MNKPKITRPFFPESYEVTPTHYLSWEQVSGMIDAARIYWLCTVSSKQRPHAVPVWGVWLDDTLIFDGGATSMHVRNISKNNNVVVHLESGTDVVIIEGTCEILSQASHTITMPVAQGYTAKYTEQGYAPSPDSWDEDGLYRVMPRQIIAWTDFVFNPTKFVFD